MSDGVHVRIAAHSTERNIGLPVRYLRNLDISIPATTFELGVGGFVEKVISRITSLGVVSSELALLWSQICGDRNDQKVASERRLEALLGFDMGEAPKDLMRDVGRYSTRAGTDAIDEVAAAAKRETPTWLKEVIDHTERSRTSLKIGSLEQIAVLYRQQTDTSNLPWHRATRAARAARDVWDIPDGPISNKQLAELVGVSRKYLEYTPTHETRIAAGLRANDAVKVALRARNEPGRRFDVMRLVADDLIAQESDMLLPATPARTDRQKFQRAFAQEFLMPFDELRNRLGGLSSSTEVEVSDEAIDDVAQEYNVSPLLVRTALVNKGYLPREVLI